MITELENHLAQERQRRDIEYRGGSDDDEGASRHWRAEFLRIMLFEIGYYFQQFDDYAHAEAKYREVLARFPESRACENAHYNLACICAIQGRRREALDELREAVRCGFTNADWLLEDGDLASLRGDSEFAAIVEEARTGTIDESGRDWVARLQPFLPAGTRSFFDLGRAAQAEVLAQAFEVLSASERRRLVEDAPADQRDAIRAEFDRHDDGR
jgi:tetratricopeptide (TPR) repeat protein